MSLIASPPFVFPTNWRPLKLAHIDQIHRDLTFLTGANGTLWRAQVSLRRSLNRWPEGQFASAEAVRVEAVHYAIPNLRLSLRVPHLNGVRSHSFLVRERTTTSIAIVPANQLMAIIQPEETHTSFFILAAEPRPSRR